MSEIRSNERKAPDLGFEDFTVAGEAEVGGEAAGGSDQAQGGLGAWSSAARVHFNSVLDSNFFFFSFF